MSLSTPLRDGVPHKLFDDSEFSFVGHNYPTGPAEDHSLHTTLGQHFQMHTRALPQARNSSRRFFGLPNFD